MKNIFYILLLFSILLMACEGTSVSPDDGDGYNRQALLENITDNIIIPAHNNLLEELQSLKAATDNLINDVSQTNLEKVRNNWLETVRNLGIRNNDQIVAYDDVGGMYAARFWWMMRWLGHENVAILDGGIQQWESKLESGENPARTTKSRYSSSKMLTKLIEINELAERLQKESSKVVNLVDARPRERFAGLNEPIDKTAGHIPGAICLPFQENLDPDLRFKKAEKLRTRFEEIYGDGIMEGVCYCGSGVSACHNILAANIAGLGELILFAGSWSEWIEDSSRPIETDY